jgi:nitrogen fixation protein FixH
VHWWNLLHVGCITTIITTKYFAYIIPLLAVKQVMTYKANATLQATKINTTKVTSRDFDAKASSRRIENDCIIINIKKSV